MDEFKNTRNLVITALMAAIAILLGWTHWGFIPWFGGVSLTIMYVPVVIAAIIVGPISGLVVGLIFGIFSMIQAGIAPTGPTDVWFTNPILSVFPVIYRSRGLGSRQDSQRWPAAALPLAGAAGSLTNTVLVLGMNRASWVLTLGGFGGSGCHQRFAGNASLSIYHTCDRCGLLANSARKRKGAKLED